MFIPLWLIIIVSVLLIFFYNKIYNQFRYYRVRSKELMEAGIATRAYLMAYRNNNKDEFLRIAIQYTNTSNPGNTKAYLNSSGVLGLFESDIRQQKEFEKNYIELTELKDKYNSLF